MTRAAIASILALALVAGLVPGAGAQIYRWVDRDEATIREVRIVSC